MPVAIDSKSSARHRHEELAWGACNRAQSREISGCRGVLPRAAGWLRAELGIEGGMFDQL